MDEDRSVTAAILTAAYLQGAGADPDRYVIVYQDFLGRLGSVAQDARKDSDERHRRRPRDAYEYSKTR